MQVSINTMYEDIFGSVSTNSFQKIEQNMLSENNQLSYKLHTENNVFYYNIEHIINHY